MGQCRRLHNIRKSTVSILVLILLLPYLRHVINEGRAKLAGIAKDHPRQLVTAPAIHVKHSFEKEQATRNDNNVTVNLCPIVPPNLIGAFFVNMEPESFEEIQKRHPYIKPGGRFQPLDCKSRHRVAIIVPFRDRESHLKILLKNLLPMLERQQLDYGIYVVEMAMPTTFNRAVLMNIGYKEALKDYDFQCFIFHDVDHIPENDLNLYNCQRSPSHLAVSVDKNNYKLPYPGAFGGVVALTKEHVIKVNGWSNMYFGWGCEDDDLYQRIHQNGLKVSRGPAEIGRYKMVKHLRDKTNQKNKDRANLLKGMKTRMRSDGLNSLKYDVLKREYRPLFAYIFVRIPVEGDTKSHH
ncbi:beta-1,4-N-acetylgalactosaminyltransferase bre-4-like [Haliotis cracherodii]|uniref:beta-1,4-N-acetylgalactosaminyltransferase bre-4-like n=1 Tax=Haliotis cracherodii TaxID=6455 RepID=UPI0039E89D9C